MSSQFLWTALFAVLAVPSPAAFCSYWDFPIARHGSAIAFVGAPVADSAVVGPRAEPCTPLTASGGICRDSIVGQIVAVEVESLVGSETDELQVALKQSSGRAIVVPWHIGANCAPQAWQTELPWLKHVGSRALWVLRRRDENVSGVPVFDAHPTHQQPYPYSFQDVQRIRYGINQPERMNVDDARRFYAALPDLSREMSPADRIRPLLQWIEENPALVTKYPAAYSISFAMSYGR